VMGNIA